MLTENKQKTNVPPLFQSIIENDEQRRITKGSGVVSFADHKRLTQAHREYMEHAENYVFGTKDKGTKI